MKSASLMHVQDQPAPVSDLSEDKYGTHSFDWRTFGSSACAHMLSFVFCSCAIMLVNAFAP